MAPGAPKPATPAAPAAKPATPAKPAGATASMPSATVPVAKPAGFTKPAGFSKPAGFGKTAPVEEDDEPKKDSPVLVVLAALSLIVVGLMCWVQYQTDQLPGRVTDADRLFGSPAAAEDVGDDSGYSEDASDEGASEEESSGDEESYADEEE